MAQKKKEVEEGGTASVRLDASLVHMATVIAAHRKMTVSELCSPVLRPFLLTQFALMSAEIAAKVEQQKQAETDKPKK